MVFAEGNAIGDNKSVERIQQSFSINQKKMWETKFLEVFQYSF